MSPEVEARLDWMADAFSHVLRMPKQALLQKRQADTLLARKAFAYCATTYLDITNLAAAAFLAIDRKELEDNIKEFVEVIDGTQLNDFEDADEALCDALEKLGSVLLAMEGKGMPELDEQTLRALGPLSPTRRFTDKPKLNPESVRGLAVDHPAMTEGRTLFPTTVVTVTEDAPTRLLVSGRNNRKLGDVVARGQFRGYALYGFSLEERATCPTDCAVRAVCYGNGMQMARRHRIGDPAIFYQRLDAEVAELLAVESGLLVRLHVLGDFPSVDYVAHWADLLIEHDALACYGYTHRRPSALGGDDIGDAIEALKQRFPDRFRIRWSRLAPSPDGAVVIDYVPDGPKTGAALVCPAQTDATACCASCGLCWEPASAGSAIAFIKHGPKFGPRKYTEKVMDHDLSLANIDTRRIQPISVPGAAKRAANVGTAPIVRVVNPIDLHIEGAYQRDLTKRSLKLIRKIVNEWDWAKFKPPICAKRSGGSLVVIDGQHTAIAAATLAIPEIPVLLVRADEISSRADSFVSHNRDRLIMSPHQLFHASAAAGDAAAIAILKLASETGVVIPRNPPVRGRPAPRQVAAINDVVAVYKKHGEGVLRRIFTIAVAAECSPLSRAATRGLGVLLTATYFETYATMKDSRIANALRPMEKDGFDKVARAHGAETGMPTERAAAVLISNACTAQEMPSHDLSR